MTISNALPDQTTRPLSEIGAVTGFAHDPVLASRDILLDERAMSPLFTNTLGRKVLSCSRLRTKYRVGQSLRVLYRVDLDSDTGPLTELVSIRAFAHGRIPTVLPPSVDGASLGSTSVDGQPIDFPAVGAIGWMFPNDRKLSGLTPFLANTDIATRLLGSPVTHTERMAYAPEKSATFRCASGPSTVGYVKLFSGGDDRRVLRIYTSLTEPLIQQGLDVPRPIAHDRSLRAVAISSVAGMPLARCNSTIDAWTRLGTALAALHRIQPPSTLERFPRTESSWLDSAERLISSARPDVAAHLRSVSERLRCTRPIPGPDVVLHGDVHAKNALLDGERVGLVDLDQMGVGSAATDLGSAIAALRAEQANPDLEHALLDGYGATATVPSTLEIEWNVAMALIGERALRAVNRVRVDALGHLDQLMTEADCALEHMHR